MTSERKEAEYCIDALNVSKTYQNGGHVVLSEVTLQVEKGSFTSIVGASGCGKTTLLRMAAGLVGHDSGHVHVRGVPVDGVPHGVGFVFQQAGLLPWRTVAQNIELGMNELRRKVSRSEIDERVNHQLELTGLTRFRDYFPGQLSGGMQQRAGLARALVADSDVLFMDEPMGALDAITRADLQVELAAIVQRVKATTLFVTHDVDEAIFLSDRIVVMAGKPAKIALSVNIPDARPREREDMLGRPEAAALRKEILGIVRADH